MSLSAGDLILLRTTQQSTELYLALVKPNTVFSAQINNASAAKGLANLNYDNASGNLANTRKGQTVYVGTTPGTSDKGRVRMRSVVTGTINVAVDNSIEYKDNDYLTIKEFHEFWPVFPRATVDDSNIVTFYKDYDIPYSNQNSLLTPIPIMGCDYAGFVSVTGSQSVYFTASDSYVSNGSSISTYQWRFPTGCVPATYVGDTPGNVVFPSAGNYNVELSVVSNTKTGTAFRNVCLLNRPGRATTNLPIMDWSLEDITGDWNNGWTAKISVGDRADEFEDGYMAIIFAEDKYGTSSQSIGGYPNREHIKFIGYINKADTIYDWQTSKTTFLLKGISALFQNKEMFSVSLESNVAPNAWTQLPNMTINEIIDHYVRWHSTLLEVVDYTQIQTVEGTYRDHYEDIPKGEIANTVNNVLGSRLLANFCSDRQNRCFSQVDLNLLPTGTRPSTALVLTDNDWIGDAKYGESLESPLSTVLLGGVSFNGTDDIGLLSRAPGTFPGYTGKSQNVSGLALDSQDQLNVLSGLYYGKYKNRFPEFTLQMANNFGQADVIPQEYWEYNLPTGRTERGTEWTHKRFIPRKISEKWADGVLSQNITFEAETNASPGVTVLIPVTPPQSTRPPIGRITRPPSTGRTGTGLSRKIMFGIADGSGKVIRTTNFLSVSPTWVDITGAITGTPLVIRIDPWNPASKAVVLSSTGVWYSSNIQAISPTWTQSISIAQVRTLIGDAAYTFDVLIPAMMMSINTNGLVGVLVAKAVGAVYSAYFLKTTNYSGGSGTWSVYSIGTDTAHSGNDASLVISQHNPQRVFASFGATDGIGDILRIHYSTNGGISWSTTTVTMDNQGSGGYLFIPHTHNDADNIIYLTRRGYGGSAANCTLITTSGILGTWTQLLDTNPPDGQPRIGSINGESLTESPAIEAGTGVYQIVYSNATTSSRMFRWNLTTRTIVHGDFGSVSNVGLGLGGWPYNNLMVQMHNAGFGTGHVGRSENGGVNWIEATGNLLTLLPSTTSVRYLVPIWV